ncbi:MAG: hypothetical protein JOZ27_07705 [Caulobacteraceae bacterium]|nr:hypothetical protein [Caulobacteraceae bacterium]
MRPGLLLAALLAACAHPAAVSRGHLACYIERQAALPGWDYGGGIVRPGCLHEAAARLGDMDGDTIPESARG